VTMLDMGARPGATRQSGRVRKINAAVAVMLPTLLQDVSGVAGIALVSYGAWLTYQPAGFIVGGAFLLAVAWLSASKE
jgi:hypothetical protein